MYSIINSITENKTAKNVDINGQTVEFHSFNSLTFLRLTSLVVNGLQLNYVN